MDLQAKLVACEQKFEQIKNERDQHIETANEQLEELTRLQGEFRLLNEMIDEQKANKSNKKAKVIEAEPEKVF